MDPFAVIFDLVGYVAAAALFAAFALTFWPSRARMGLATTLYGVGVLGWLSLYAFFYLIRRSLGPPPHFLMMQRIVAALFLVFAIAAVALLWPSIPQRTAFRCGLILFFAVAPALTLLRMIPDYFQFRHLIPPIDLTWLLFAVLWFRIREKNQNQAVSC